MEARQTRENYLRQREDEVESTRNQLENKALTLLSEDLSDQLSGLYENAQKLTGKITPFGFEQMLQEKLFATTSEYENYIKESTLDLENTEDDIL